ncbi:hypothetical protein [Streptomyces sp. NPDC050355]|uniref:hypothetical protein n=1 Tax=Streptomyces sp. NPDC050355 TaxID=3365609 RepID=UPI0037A938C4
MNKTRMNLSKRTVLRTALGGAALGMAFAAGATTTAYAVGNSTPHVVTKAPADWGDQNNGIGGGTNSHGWGNQSNGMGGGTNSHGWGNQSNGMS